MSLQRESQTAVASTADFLTRSQQHCRFKAWSYQLFHAVTFIGPAADDNVDTDTQEKYMKR